MAEFNNIKLNWNVCAALQLKGGVADGCAAQIPTVAQTQTDIRG